MPVLLPFLLVFDVHPLGLNARWVLFSHFEPYADCCDVDHGEVVGGASFS